MLNADKIQPDGGRGRFCSRRWRLVAFGAVGLVVVVVALTFVLFTGTSEFEPLAQRLLDHSSASLSRSYNQDSHDEFVKIREEYEQRTEGRRLNLTTKKIFDQAMGKFRTIDEAFWKKHVKPEGESLIREMGKIWLEYKEALARQILERRSKYDEKCSWWINRENDAMQIGDDDANFYPGVQRFLEDFVLQANRFDKVVGATHRPYQIKKQPS